MGKRLKKKPNKREVVIVKNKDIGNLPIYINLAHRHLEKEMPEGLIVTLDPQTRVIERGKYSIPVDLASMVLPSEYASNIENIELEYERVL